MHNTAKTETHKQLTNPAACILVTFDIRHRINRTFLFFSLLAPVVCDAGPLEYVCTIKQELSVTNDGNLKSYENPIEVGNTFGIDRRTGKIIGRPLSNSTAREVKIITQGDSSRNFEVLSASSPTGKATTDLVIVHEWQKDHEKAFIGLSSGTVYSGTCK
ncbi:hypothetical protein [Nitrosomonas sp. sh817]|uniref:hypothetical protein n=1 Tax=Nitrosomonas sp. sh817 TaxID=3070658 RepID=UPI0027DC74AF|nr:hypothetical protein [Nitrosomonas sp. sh817]WMJ08719.1 hypothetical protein RBH92_00485 [Nitrosomonas sp. sh817]